MIRLNEVHVNRFELHVRMSVDGNLSEALSEEASAFSQGTQGYGKCDIGLVNSEAKIQYLDEEQEDPFGRKNRPGRVRPVAFFGFRQVLPNLQDQDPRRKRALVCTRMTRRRFFVEYVPLAPGMRPLLGNDHSN